MLTVTFVPPDFAVAGCPSFGHPAHRNASPKSQFPHALLKFFFSSSVSSFFGADPDPSPPASPSPAASISARPHEQFLHAFADVLQSPAPF
jgi:hypothetical protein